MTRRRLATALAALAVLTAGGSGAGKDTSPERYITVASTTSTENSGLFSYLLPIFHDRTGIAVHVVGLGTGQALDVGRRGDADVVFVHDKVAEEQFVAEGFGIERRDVMYNDLVLIGPKADPAGIASGRDGAAALRAIVAQRAPFVSRGDRSGTHAAELRLWAAAGIDIESEKGPWYRETGAGMGASLNTATAMNAYLLSDRATWLAFGNGRSLALLVEGDHRLFNQYGVMMVNPARHPQVKHAEARAFIDWLTSADGQASIAAFRINGEQAFFPNARADETRDTGY
jgi:tungstate transport system substrate-binding protein